MVTRTMSLTMMVTIAMMLMTRGIWSGASSEVCDRSDDVGANAERHCFGGVVVASVVMVEVGSHEMIVAGWMLPW